MPGSIVLDEARLAALPPLASLREEITSGLASQAERLESAWTAEEYYQLRGAQFLEKREAEDDLDFARRPKRTSALTRFAVRKLSEPMYSPGPVRVAADRAVSEWIGRVYADVHVDAVMAEADRGATLAAVCAVQVEATGDPACPVRLQLWKAHQFAVYCVDGDPRTPWAVVTKDVVDAGSGRLRTRYRAWTARELQTWLTEPYTPGESTSGCRRADTFDAAASGASPYPGVLPFVFVRDCPAVGGFWDGGLGHALVETNRELDRGLSAIAEHVDAFLNPTRWARNVSVQSRFIERVNGWLVLKGDRPSKEGLTSNVPELGYLQPSLAVEEAWADCRNTINQRLEELEVPVRLEADGPTSDLSGVALALRTVVPLQARTSARQVQFVEYEADLYATICAVAGAWYGNASLSAAAAARDLAVSWPPPKFPIPSAERTAEDQAELDMGLTDPIELLARRRGQTIEQAEETLRAILRRRKLWADLVAAQQPETPAPATPPDDPDDPDDDEETEDDGRRDPDEPDDDGDE